MFKCLYIIRIIMQQRVSLIFFFCINFPHFSQTLRINRLEVPPAIPKGSPVALHCDFDLQGDTLYSVKWYKNYVEFYRYHPFNVKKPTRIFKLSGIYIDISMSNISHVFMTRTDLDSEGIYSCEVSTDSPTFVTIRVQQQMKIYIWPLRSAQLEPNVDDTIIHELNDNVNLTCVLGASRPSSQLTWYINNVPAQRFQLKYHQPLTHSDGSQTNKLGLHFKPRREHFIDGELLLRCSAMLVLTYHVEAFHSLPEYSSFGDEIEPYINEDLFIESEKQTNNRGKNSVNGDDQVRVNCTTIVRDSYLQWFINDEEVNGTQLTEYKTNSSFTLMLTIEKEQLEQITEIRLKCKGLILRTVAKSTRIVHFRLKDTELVSAHSAPDGLAKNVTVKGVLSSCLINIMIILAASLYLIL